MQEVILVDRNDRQTGSMEKLRAHQEQMLHRAVSVFVFNSKKEMLLQKRAADKYHCGGLWSNASCTHPGPGESAVEAAQRRLREEMGMDVPVQEAFSFTYFSHFREGLAEHELDHAFIAISDKFPSINSGEVSEFRYAGANELRKDVLTHPENYTPWFRMTFNQAFEAI